MNHQLIHWCYGGGRDSTAGIIRCVELGIPIDFITFADVGSEKQCTYEYVDYFSDWLKSKGYPEVVKVQYEPKTAPYDTLEGNMCMNCTLPSPALGGMHSCSIKWKINPQDKWSARNRATVEAWARGERILKLIGYECTETKRANKVLLPDRRFKYHFPLMDWEWDLERIVNYIMDQGMEVPEKSSCFFCPMMKEDEIRRLSPQELGRIMRMEVYAEPYNKKVHGLWGRPRKRDGRPGSITEFILDEGLLWSWPDDDMPMNPNCGKRKHGYTMKPPHIDKSLREIIESRTGFVVPEQPLLEVADECDDQLVMNL